MWKHSRIRFYILNAYWNYKFWLLAEKVFKEHSYEVIEEDDLNLDNVDITGKIIYNKKRKHSKKRFVGYLYEGIIYLDNPGIRHLVKKSTWEAWRKKKLI